jgi:histidyl-tRNA synthetase
VVPEADGSLAELAAVSDTLTALGVPHSVSPVLVRHFEYYTGPVFHIRSGGAKVGGGGRYDNLVPLAGGPATPASGFALEADALSRLLPGATGQAEGAIAIRSETQDAAGLAAAFTLAQALRRAGCKVEVVPAREAAPAEAVLASADGYAQGGRRWSSVEAAVRALAGTPS